LSRPSFGTEGGHGGERESEREREARERERRKMTGNEPFERDREGGILLALNMPSAYPVLQSQRVVTLPSAEELHRNSWINPEVDNQSTLRSHQRALPTKTKVESGTSQSKRGTSVDSSNSGTLQGESSPGRVGVR
jgi:hypothetical protein